MLRRETALSFLTFGFLFIIQEAFINQVRLPLGGFSLIMLAALIWSSISELEIASLTGFIAGLYLDLSPTTDGPFGQWTLVMVLACFTISYLGYGADAVNSNPAGLIVMTVVAVIGTLVFYLIVGLIFGLNLGSVLQVIKSLLGISIWSALIAPIIVPFISRTHAMIYSGS